MSQRFLTSETDSLRNRYPEELTENLSGPMDISSRRVYFCTFIVKLLLFALRCGRRRRAR
eukprot:COSAG02_NODE_549_length_20461_cov_11.385866_15_plen_60_part_00